MYICINMYIYIYTCIYTKNTQKHSGVCKVSIRLWYGFMCVY